METRFLVLSEIYVTISITPLEPGTFPNLLSEFCNGTHSSPMGACHHR